MDDLIAKINKIRDAFKTVDVPPEIQLPQFVVVGAQVKTFIYQNTMV